MGADKALLHIDGRAMATRVADALRAAGADPVVAIGGDPGALTALGLTVIPDLHPGDGPLGAVLTALDALQAEVVAILACDLVDPAAETIRTVVQHAASPAVDVAVPVVEGRPHFHHAAWRRSAADRVREQFAAGERAPRRAAHVLRVVEVHEVAMTTLRDADDPAQLEAARREIHGRGSHRPTFG
jgi:molybdopterin-guanine dinucleotide biosynthesis protein A